MAAQQETEWTAEGALEREETVYEGRYIPYSGGSAGWFENSGVMRGELANNYRFYTAVDAMRVKQRRFERLGADLARRNEQRVRARGLQVELQAGSLTFAGTLQDFSESGVQVRLAEDPGLSEGQSVELHVEPNSFFQTSLALINAEVRWVKQVRLADDAWHVGITYGTV